jgi:hypothetical protein
MSLPLSPLSAPANLFPGRQELVHLTSQLEQGRPGSALSLYTYFARRRDYWTAARYLLSAVDQADLNACNVAQDLDPHLLNDHLDPNVRLEIAARCLISSRMRYVLVVATDAANQWLSSRMTWTELASACMIHPSWTVRVVANQRDIGHAFMSLVDREEVWFTQYPSDAVKLFRVQELDPPVEFDPSSQLFHVVYAE